MCLQSAGRSCGDWWVQETSAKMLLHGVYDLCATCLSSSRWLAWTISYVSGKVPSRKRGQASEHKHFKRLLALCSLMSHWPTKVTQLHPGSRSGQILLFDRICGQILQSIGGGKLRTHRIRNTTVTEHFLCFSSCLFSLYPLQSPRPAVLTTQELWSLSILGLTSSLHHNLKGKYPLVLGPVKTILRIKVIGLACMLGDEDGCLHRWSHAEHAISWSLA